ncbi:hypothetical protein QAO71_00760 [Halopseudomonas sp. SMJS2]|uniref:hypothetical protein n=1 Tax=Halopseudomonas sp. SMJS2 TaxID=3041098 RepID=UPI002453624D|nr:hypothetical protein [Halopseudomonas sp. SMJS2]WGK61823.1 hypothetical protein QAO71_00760 [Halopseudomonas sp. SMJS2]
MIKRISGGFWERALATPRIELVLDAPSTRVRDINPTSRDGTRPGRDRPSI